MGLQAGWVCLWVGDSYSTVCVCVCPHVTRPAVCLQCTEAELTEDYRRERDQLRAELMEGIVPKEKNGKSNTVRIYVEILQGQPD